MPGGKWASSCPSAFYMNSSIVNLNIIPNSISGLTNITSVKINRG